MSGTFINVTAKGQRTIAKSLNALLKQSGNLTPVLTDIADYLLASTQRRFVDQQAPDGTPWAALSSTTLARKARVDRILTESGTLADNLHYQMGHDQFELGSNEEYAAMQHFGGITSAHSMMPGSEIPAREIVGLAPFERNEIYAMIEEHLKLALGN